MNIQYSVKPFSDLTTQELYEILALRIEVFIVEQYCPFQDLDGKDQQCLHFIGRDEAGRLATYVRLVPPGVSYDTYSSIGRVCTAEFARGKGMGKQLMLAAITAIYELYPNTSIKIGAQKYLTGFYESVGFRLLPNTDYLEDKIIHVQMMWRE